MDKRELYREKIESQLKEWRAKIDQLEGRLASLSSEAKEELKKDIQDLRSQKTVIREKWNELQKSGGEAWDRLTEGLEKASAELKEALEKALSRFR